MKTETSEQAAFRRPPLRGPRSTAGGRSYPGSDHRRVGSPGSCWPRASAPVLCDLRARIALSSRDQAHHDDLVLRAVCGPGVRILRRREPSEVCRAPLGLDTVVEERYHRQLSDLDRLELADRLELRCWRV